MEHDQISVGPYGLAQSLEALLDLGAIDAMQLRGIELRYRDITPAESFEEALASGYTSLVRLGVDDGHGAVGPASIGDRAGLSQDSSKHGR